MIGSRLSLRRILLLIIGSLTLIITLLAGRNVYGDWQRLTNIRALRDGAASSDQLFNAAEKLAVERDVALSMLYTPDSDTVDDLRVRLEESRRDADMALRDIATSLDHYTFPELSSLRQQIESHLSVIPVLRAEIDQAVKLPPQQRNRELPERWSTEVTELMSEAERLWIGFVRHFTNVDPIVTQHLWFKYVLRAITDHTGRERSLIGKLIAEDADPTSEQIALLLRGRGIVETNWQMGLVLAEQSGLSAGVGPDYTDASSHYFTMHDMIRDLFYVPTVRNGAPYPIDVDLWFELSTQASASLETLRESSIRETSGYIEGLISRMQADITIQVAVFMFALLLCAYSFSLIVGRVIQPINNMVAALMQATRGEPVTFIPPSGRQDEIGNLATVLQAFQQNVERIKLTSAELERSQDHFRAVVETAVDGVILVDSHGVIRMLNPAAERLFGYQRGEGIDRNVATLIPSFGEQKPGQVSEIHGTRKDGSSFPIGLSLGQASPGGELILVGVVRDLTARKRTQQQLVQAQKMEAVGQLTGGMAHDFNNLLTVIIGSLDMLEGELKSHPKAQTLAELALKGSLKAAELTRQLLAFSRRQTLEPKVVSLNELVSGTTQLLSRTLGEQIQIKLLLADDLWPMLADPAQVESSLANLSINARDAMPEGGYLTIETANKTLDEQYGKDNAETAPGDYVMLAVSDTGTGMPPEVLERVFEPFFTTKAEGRGTGLGLSMVYGFAKQSGGHVKIYSEVGHGTTVRIYLPRAETDAAVESNASADIEEPFETATILMVEDNPDVRPVVARQLKELGYEVIEAENSQMALSVLESSRPIDLLFTDVVMPGSMSGDQLAEEASRLRPGLKILFTSGFAEASMQTGSRPRDLGGHKLLSKPYRKIDLARRIHETLTS
jgi:two-component system, cell cycle sensor histidine kinase and response regulator CckA